MKAINPNEIKDNFIELIGKEWMLVSAGDKEKFNMMTASWGGVGVLWNRPVVFAFIRPERYTREFIGIIHFLLTSAKFTAEREVIGNRRHKQTGTFLDVIRTVERGVLVPVLGLLLIVIRKRIKDTQANHQVFMPITKLDSLDILTPTHRLALKPVPIRHQHIHE